MNRTLIPLMLLGAALGIAQLKPEVAFRAAMETETVKGDLKGAIEQYKRIAQGTDRALAARALLRMADCHAKLGQGEAETIYRRVLREYPDQRESAGEAQKRLAELGGAKPEALAKRRLCADCGDSAANLSADGKWMAFTHWDSGDLAIRDLSTMAEKRLMLKPGSWKDSDAYVEFPVFSPDARQIAYLWFVSNTLPGQLRIVANEPGSKPRVVLDTPENLYYHPVAWSADGKDILTVLEKPDRTWQLAWVTAVDGKVTVLKSLGWRLLHVRARPRLSPDGRFIAYNALAVNPKSRQAPLESVEQRIYVLAADGSSETELVKTAGVNNYPVWTADGKRLLFTSDRSGSFALWSVDVRDGRAAGPPSMVDPMPNETIGMTAGGTLYYAQRSREVEQVSLEELESRPASSQSRISDEQMFVGIRPTWSPDGRLVAFTRRRAAGAWYVVVKSVETGEETAYPFEGTRPAPNRWFHDGKGLLVMVDPPGKPRTLYRLDLATKEYRVVLEAPVDRFAPAITALAPDDKTLFIGARNADTAGLIDEIIAIDLATGERRRIFEARTSGGSRDPLFFRLSPDGRMLSTRRRDPSDKKVHYGVLAADGSGYREIHITDNNAFNTHAWARDGRSLLLEHRTEGKWRIMRVPIDGGPPEPTGIQGTGELHTLDSSPDGRRIAFSTLRSLNELWALDNLQAVLP